MRVVLSVDSDLRPAEAEESGEIALDEIISKLNPVDAKRLANVRNIGIAVWSPCVVS